ncbi:SDR family oxidoreductase [Caldimonas thermodepolymerans]|jgi:UDP-glucuronate decarboxylase|uniref:NAD-dependent dehydratase n=1 Tax=Caldimonas thermodepolymerans TaxID=215580 RepID=A0A2S5T487_9BURK|nr:UDP-glucuronic acid decarboxylase family protein [Caldimonas thermodepolymerans]PPE69793.1 NAD-dependent dehydratase [Caldimonas thermodepolymerans]QPC32627.1 SDR family oxidoreductase [Caldimonas thermodepolymerans]RDI03379.1 UDP-glucuronate decarboxylase [Caldimonas thermodepolymerans]TCP06762.1 UDP-glucuronate decarboxylase [Caldimonas thermodepolymerans]UZG45433.1 SDR family oxidoreductase [Caldimonas thermodepolymerans]
MGPRDVTVAGGAGFLGSHLCDRLLDAGHRVHALDNFCTGSPLNVGHLRRHPRFALTVHDVIRTCRLDADGIFNFACPASPEHYQRDPVHTTLSSVAGVHHLLDAARRCGARLLQSSTSEIYGDPEIHPQVEGYRGCVSVLGPRACYDEGKRCAETLCLAYHRQYGVPVRIARIFNTYGPRMQPGDGRVVSNFIVQALRGEDITIYGEGQQTRSFCYVDDLVEGIVRLMDADLVGPVNLGNPVEHTVLELAEAVLRLTGSRSRLVHRPLPADDPRRRCPDIGLARERLGGWQPAVTLEDGLKETVAWFRRRLGLQAPRVAAPARVPATTG